MEEKNALPNSEVLDGQKEQIPEKKSKKKLAILIAFILVILTSGIVFLFFKTSLGNSPSVVKLEERLSVSTPTPIPFFELTVPYLRSREYSSKLGPLELAYNGSLYKAYVTSYDSDGFKVNGLLTIPTEEELEGGFPAIVFIHGYIPPTQYQTQGQYADYVDYLARNGFVVFKIDLRGHGTSEGEAGGGYYGSDYIADTLNAYSALQNSGFVNPNEIGLWGHSMAGNVVMRSFAAKPEIPAVVIWAGAVYTYEDMQKYGISDSSYRPPEMSTQRNQRRQRIREVHGNPSSESAFWKLVAPTSYLNDLKGAIEVHHAVDDGVVNIGYSRDLMNLLDKTNVSHQLFEYQSGGHNITGSSFVEAMNRTVDFYKKNLDK